MDIEIAEQTSIPQATQEDLERVFEADFRTPLELVRNYGDRLEATALDDDGFRLAYYDAVAGRRYEVAAHVSQAQVKDAFFDYFQGNWNWHQRHEWRTM